MAAAVTETAASGGVSAAFSYDKSGGDFPQYSNLRLAIVREGVPGFNGPVAGAGDGVGPGAGIGKKSLVARDLDGDGEPEVLVKLFSGGAHCCTISAIYRHVGTGYAPSTHNWADTGFRIRDLGGDARPELLSADARFAFLYSSFAESRFPIRILRYKAGKLTSVTRRFPRLIRRDLRRQKRSFRRLRKHLNPRGALAAVVADQYLLKHRKAARRSLRGALRRGELGKTGDFHTGAFGRAYIRSLKRFLTRTGYRR
ncbi:MAG: hypothetical protein ACR2NH_09265 [Solirubrobacteraceae bacterium]